METPIIASILTSPIPRPSSWRSPAGPFRNQEQHAPANGNADEAKASTPDKSVVKLNKNLILYRKRNDIRQQVMLEVDGEQHNERTPKDQPLKSAKDPVQTPTSQKANKAAVSASTSDTVVQLGCGMCGSVRQDTRSSGRVRSKIHQRARPQLVHAEAGHTIDVPLGSHKMQTLRKRRSSRQKQGANDR